jgi:multicomponent Na+:H+ antiporter subunit B
MTIRGLLFLVLAAAAAALAVGGLAGLAPFGHYPGPYGDIINAVGTSQRHVTNMVTAVTFDYRGFDTLGEEYMLFTAVTGVALLLRDARGTAANARPKRIRGRPRLGRSEAVMAAGRWFAPVTMVYGIYVVLHAQLTPGGGFQGGVVIASALLFFYLGEGYRQWRETVRAPVLDPLEAAGTGLYAAAGFAGLLSGHAFLENVLPLGTTGDLVSGGLIIVLNLGVALAVAAGFALLFVEFLQETRQFKGERT